MYGLMSLFLDVQTAPGGLGWADLQEKNETKPVQFNIKIDLILQCLFSC